MENLIELYLRFEYLNNKKVTAEPWYTLDTTEILTGLSEAINKKTSSGYPLTKQQIQMLKSHLERNNGLFYYKEGIEVPFKIDNTRHIKICDEILTHMENGD